MSNFIEIRKLFFLDFVFAAVGAIIYYFLFDFIVETLSLPAEIVQIQLYANFSYAIYGLVLYVSNTNRIKFFKFLIAMNFIYAALCLLAGLIIALKGIYWGAVLLLAEAFLIGILANYERKLISRY